MVEADQMGINDSLDVGDKTSGELMKLFMETYKLEVVAEEDVHRTLPFFAASAGFLIGAFTYTANQLPPFDAWFGLRVLNGHPFNSIGNSVSAMLLILGFTFLLVSLRQISVAVEKRDYKRLDEIETLRRAQALTDFYRRLQTATPQTEEENDREESRSTMDSELDALITADLRNQILDQMAPMIRQNREASGDRYSYRAAAVKGVVRSLFCALFSTIIALGVAKLDPVIKDSTNEQPKGSPVASRPKPANPDGSASRASERGREPAN